MSHRNAQERIQSRRTGRARSRRRSSHTFGAYIEKWRERALQGVGIPGESNSTSYILAGLAAEDYPPDAATDALA